MKRVLLGSLLAVVFVLPVTAEEPPPGSRFAIAIEKGDVEAIEGLLTAGNKADTWIEYGENKITPLMKACSEGEQKIVEVLIAAGANVNAQASGWGETPLGQAVSRDRVEIATLLIGKGAKLETKNKQGFTPLIQAAAGGNLEMVNALLVAGGNPNAEDMVEFTPLKYAVTADKPEVVRALVAKGAKVDKTGVKTNPGQTALHMAIGSGKVEMVKLLLELKANPNARKKDGETPLSLARKGDQEDVIKLLKAAGAK